MGLSAVEENDGSPAHRAGYGAVRGFQPLVFALTYVALATYMIASYRLGLPMSRDADDFLKLHEIRSFLATGAIFDRTLPDILQPEPYVSHWPWIVDLPYALLAWPLAPFIGEEHALTAAVVAVPLLLLAPALFCYERLLAAVGFGERTVALPLAALVALPGLCEFAPGRIDYHNLQVLLLLIGLVLLLRQSQRAAFANGLAVALGTAISLEFAAFHALLIGVYAFDFISGRAGAGERMAWFGSGLALAAAMLFIGIVPPAEYGLGRCDTYSAPFALALVLAGAVFVALPLLLRHGGWPLRTCLLALAGAAALGIVIGLFPACLGGPYAGLDAELRAYVLAGLGQEKSFLQRGDIVLSDSLPSLAVVFIGALAPAAVWLIGGRRDRTLVIVALFSLLAVVQAVAYFRYLRYLPLFSGIGVTLVLAALLPPNLAQHVRLACAGPEAPWRRLALLVPGVALTLFLVGYHLIVRQAAAMPSASDIAGGGCGLTMPLPSYDWPPDTVVLAPPLLGLRLLAMQPHPVIVATAHHRSAPGTGRVAHFLDPGTEDPRSILAETRATLVAVCARPGALPAAVVREYPFAASLMEGGPPPWLRECNADANSSLRLYSYGQAPCPSLTDR